MEYNPSQKAGKKARTRYRFKAANNEEVDAEPRQPVKFADVAAAARSAVTRLWSCLMGEDSTFEVAKAFWPSEESQSDMCKELTENILRNVAALKWRLLARLAQPPLSCVELEKYMENGSFRISPDEQEDEEMASALSRHCEKLLSSKSCCLDWNWARQVRDEVQACAREDREKCFSKHVASFLRSFRGSSLQEETTHALQRKIAAGDAGHARRFHSQASNFVVQRLARAFHRRGGRQLNTAPAAVKAAAKEENGPQKASAIWLSGVLLCCADAEAGRPTNHEGPAARVEAPGRSVESCLEVTARFTSEDEEKGGQGQTAGRFKRGCAADNLACGRSGFPSSAGVHRYFFEPFPLARLWLGETC